MKAFNDNNKEDGDQEEVGGEMMRHNKKYRGDQQGNHVFLLVHKFKEQVRGEYHEEMPHG